jgi:hypothetical protein
MAKGGEPFEIKVKERLESELQSGKLGIMPECAKVFHHKSYFSQQRNKSIVVDVVIELYREGADTPYLLWVWECKDYTHKVPVDDVEEFHAKVEQIGQHKTKATIVCRNGFQGGAVTYAQNIGIGLVRMVPDGSLIRLQEAVRPDRIPRRLVELMLTQEPTEVFFNSAFFGLLSSGEGVNSLSEMIMSEIG